MNAISQILTADQILLDLDASSKKRVFEHAGMLFEQKLGMPRASIFDSLFAREKLGSTGLGQGIAIPHGRIKGLKQAAGAVIRLQTPIPFDSPDGKPVSVVTVRPGDTVLVRTDVAGRHFGMRIAEDIKEG